MHSHKVKGRDLEEPIPELRSERGTGDRGAPRRGGSHIGAVVPYNAFVGCAVPQRYGTLVHVVGAWDPRDEITHVGLLPGVCSGGWGDVK